MYKVFIYDKPVLISKTSQFSGSFEQIYQLGSKTEILTLIQDDKVTGIEIITNSPEKTFQEFSKEFKCITAAGGAVFNKKKELLVIYRLKKWDLPKGKLEKGENIPTCAIREVEEECNVNELTIQKQLPTTYHCYYFKEKWVLKTTYWFLMETSYEGKLIPQTEEDIEAVEWLPKSQWEKIYNNSYQSIIEVVKTL